MKNNKEAQLKEFWRKNVSLIGVLLTIWFVVSFGIVILFGDVLSNVKFFGTTLSFWFGQQGSILTFIGLILVYAVKMDKISQELENHNCENELLEGEGA